jgi:hypothetical protein
MKAKYYLRVFWLIIIFSFVAWLISIVLNPQGQQLDCFYTRMGEFLGDATYTTGFVRELDPYRNEVNGSWNHNYPPLAYVFFYILAYASGDTTETFTYPLSGYLSYYYQPLWTMLFMLALLISIILIYTVCISNISQKYAYPDIAMTGLALCLSYPMLWVIERGNILIIAILTVSVFMFYYDSSCKWKKEIALICLAISTGIKISPAIFSLLLVLKKDWGALVRLILYMFLLLIVPFFFFKDGLQNLPLMISNIKLWFLYRVVDASVTGTGLIPSYIKFARLVFGNDYFISKWTYSILMLVSGEVSLILMLGLLQLKEQWKKILNITLVLLIMPLVSYRYNVLYFIPFTITFFNVILKEPIGTDKVVIFCCLIMLFFVYRCPISELLNYQFAIPMLTAVALVYSVKAFIKAKHIFL